MLCEILRVYLTTRRFIMKEIKWAVLGTGVIANEMAQALIKNGKNIYSVANRTHQKAVDFAQKYNIGKVYDNMNDVFTDPEVDVVYITTPHNTHLEFMKKAIENGKHILVEKSITLNSDELNEAISLAKEKGVIIGEAMTIFHMPIYKKLNEILESGALGKVNLITMNFGSFKEYDMTNRFFNRNLAGGAMLDIGVYALSFIRWFMDSKPNNLVSQVKSAPTGVDEQAGLLLTNEEGQMASVMISLHSKQPKRGMVSCEKGYIEIMEYPRAWKATITYTDSGKTELIKAGENADALAYELADMEKAINGDVDCMHFDYTKDVMDMMTEFRKSWGFKYPEEEK
jgi:predicted dehydrogenase